jgi:hypothetical protein
MGKISTIHHRHRPPPGSLTLVASTNERQMRLITWKRTMSARFAARLGRDPAVLLFVGGAAGGGGLLAVRPVGRVEGAGGGTLRPV